MNRLLSFHSALFLLAILTAGGVLAPVLHKVQHTAEWKEARSEHVAVGSHHHHAASDDHGSEVLPPCPDPLSAELACVLCHVIPVHTLAILSAEAPHSRAVARVVSEDTNFPTGGWATSFIRGPPAVA